MIKVIVTYALPILLFVTFTAKATVEQDFNSVLDDIRELYSEGNGLFILTEHANQSMSETVQTQRHCRRTEKRRTTAWFAKEVRAWGDSYEEITGERLRAVINRFSNLLGTTADNSTHQLLRCNFTQRDGENTIRVIIFYNKRTHHQYVFQILPTNV